MVVPPNVPVVNLVLLGASALATVAPVLLEVGAVRERLGLAVKITRIMTWRRASGCHTPGTRLSKSRKLSSPSSSSCLALGIAAGTASNSSLRQTAVANFSSDLRVYGFLRSAFSSPFNTHRAVIRTHVKQERIAKHHLQRPKNAPAHPPCPPSPPPQPPARASIRPLTLAPNPEQSAGMGLTRHLPNPQP